MKFKTNIEMLDKFKEICQKYDPNGEIELFKQFIQTFERVDFSKIKTENMPKDPKIVNFDHRFHKTAVELAKIIEDFEVEDYDFMVERNGKIIKQFNDEVKSGNYSNIDKLIAVEKYNLELVFDRQKMVESVHGMIKGLQELDNKMTIIVDKIKKCN